MSWGMSEVMLRIVRQGTRSIVATAFVCALALHASVVVAQGDFEIEIKGDLIWLSADRADLRQLLHQFAIESDFKLWISANLPQQSVSLNSEGKSAEATLRRLLSDNSYALVYGDDATISALYVLPTGESHTTNLPLSPSNGENRRQVLLNALQSGQVPSDIKAAMLDQFGANPKILQQSVISQRIEAVERLIEQLELVGSPSLETMQQLRLKLETEINPKSE